MAARENLDVDGLSYQGSVTWAQARVITGVSVLNVHRKQSRRVF